MRTYLDCYPCFLRQTLEAGRIAGADEVQIHAMLGRVLDLLKHVDLASTPPEIGDRVHRLVRDEVDHKDPYKPAKEAATREALALYPRLKTLVDQADDPLDTAIRLSIAGNIIDFGPAQAYDLWETVERVLAQPFAVDDQRAFRDALAHANWVLYLADNAGETVFDRVLIETLDAPVIYAVKSGPVLNDATEEDAVAAGVDRVADVIDTGTDSPGTVLARCSQAFRELYAQAGVVIAKGQANYETLSEEGPRTFFLLQTKCPVIARDIGVPVGSVVLKRGQRARTTEGR